MVKFKQIIALAAVVMAVVSGCSKDPVSSEGVDNTLVNLRLDDVFQEKVYVRLTHNGDRGDYWYYMITTDLNTDADLLLNERIADDLEDDGELVGNVGVNKNITFDELAAEWLERVKKNCFIRLIVIVCLSVCRLWR